MRKQFRQILIVGTLIVAIGGHWALLQSVAWVGMLVTNVRDCSLPEAIEKTFDGEHPCGLCKIVAAGKQAEKKQDVKKAEARFELLLEFTSCVLYPPPVVATVFPSVDFVSSRVEAPPVPPPRAV